MSKKVRKGSNRRPSFQHFAIHESDREFQLFSSDFETAAAANFEYTFVIDGVSVKKVNINRTIIHATALTGKIFAEKSKMFFIQILASRTSPNGTGTFQLKDLDKDKNVFSEPVALTFGSGGNGGIFLKDVKLP